MYAERLKKIRNQLRLTVNEIADVLQMKARTYGSYEREENNVSIELVTSLCKNLNVNANWFVTGEGEMFNAPKYEQVESELAQRLDKMESALKNAGILKD